MSLDIQEEPDETETTEKQQSQVRGSEVFLWCINVFKKILLFQKTFYLHINVFVDLNFRNKVNIRGE